MKLLVIRKRKRFLALISLAVLGIGGLAFYLLLAKMGFLMPLSELPSVLCLTSCTPERSLHQAINNEKLLNYDRSLPEILGENIARDRISILVEKSQYRLTVFYKLQPVKSYPIVLGTSPIGDKLAEGDRKTPEGIYRIRSLYPHSSWSKFIWLDYPTSQSWREHLQAKLTGKLNWSSTIGGEIGIHGVPIQKDSLIDERSNWTWGCISLKNRDVDEIYKFVGNGTVVEILR
jgi:murein L,D-transpeptidase YafK